MYHFLSDSDKNITEAGEKAEVLRTLAPFPEDPGSIPRTTWQFAVVCNSSSRELQCPPLVHRILSACGPHKIRPSPPRTQDKDNLKNKNF